MNKNFYYVFWTKFLFSQLLRKKFTSKMICALDWILKEVFSKLILIETELKSNSNEACSENLQYHKYYCSKKIYLENVKPPYNEALMLTLKTSNSHITKHWCLDSSSAGVLKRGVWSFLKYLLEQNFQIKKNVFFDYFFDLINHYNLLKGIGNVEKTFTLKVTNFNIAKPWPIPRFFTG